MGCGASAKKYEASATAKNAEAGCGHSDRSCAADKEVVVETEAPPEVEVKKVRFQKKAPAANGGQTADFKIEAIGYNSPVWAGLCQLLDVTDPENLGWGCDVSDKKTYNKLEPFQAWKIDNFAREAAYYCSGREIAKEFQQIASSWRALPSGIREDLAVEEIHTKLDGAGRALGMSENANGKYLLCGVKPKFLHTILHEGLNERLASTFFGHGISLYDDPQQVDQHCTADPGDALHDTLRKQMFDDANVVHPGGCLYYAVVCHVTLGIPVWTRDGQTNLYPPPPLDQATNSTWPPVERPSLYTKPGKNRKFAPIPGALPAMQYHSLIALNGRRREFVVFDGSRVLEKYVIAFRRLMDPSQPVPTWSGGLADVLDELGHECF